MSETSQNGFVGRRCIVVQFVLLALSITMGVCSAAGTPIRMFSITELQTTPPKPEVIGANPADHAEWAATLIFRSPTGAPCTATAVGPRVILSAAHCIPDGMDAYVWIANSNVAIACERHPAYPAENADFTLCLVTDTLSYPAKGFETINVDRQSPSVGEEVTLLGYGCYSKEQRIFGNLYKGPATVETLASDSGLILTKGGAAICFGDSGGGAYRFLDEAKTIRRLFGVNARGDISTISALAVTATDLFINWSRQWAENKKVTICGIVPPPTGCRQ